MERIERSRKEHCLFIYIVRQTHCASVSDGVSRADTLDDIATAAAAAAVAEAVVSISKDIDSHGSTESSPPVYGTRSIVC